MNTLTFNRNYSTSDFIFIASCDITCADLLDSRSMDKRITLELNTGRSLGAKLKSLFRSK